MINRDLNCRNRLGWLRLGAGLWLCLFTPTAARTQLHDTIGATELSSGRVKPGQKITLQTPGALQSIRATYKLVNRDSGETLATIPAQNDSKLSAQVTIPPATKPGEYRIELDVGGDKIPRSACLTVTAASHVELPVLGCSTLPDGPFATLGNQIVDAKARPVRISGVAWAGTDRGAGAAPDGLWSQSYKTILESIKEQGFNTIRIPWTDANLFTRPNGSSGDYGHIDNSGTFNNLDLRDPNFPQPDAQGRFTYRRTIEIFRIIADYADTLGLKIIFDHHSNEGDSGQQWNGLWFDLDPAKGMISNCKSPGTTTYATFKRNGVTLARALSSHRAVIGFELHNEPADNENCRPPTRLNWGASHDAYDLKFMAEDVGNAILAVNPQALIIVEGPLEHSPPASTGMNPAVKGADGDLSAVIGFAGQPPRPIRLNIPNRLVYSVHIYPHEIADRAALGQPYNLSDWNDEWGFIVREKIAPVLVSEIGAFLQDHETPANPGRTSPDAARWLAQIIPYLNGQSGAQGGPTFSGNEQPVSTIWWQSGTTAGPCCQPNGTQTGWGHGQFRPEVRAILDQLRFTGLPDGR